MEFHFRRHFRLRSKMKDAFSVGLYIKLFQITPYVNDFQTVNNPGSGQPVSKINFTLHFWDKCFIEAIEVLGPARLESAEKPIKQADSASMSVPRDKPETVHQYMNSRLWSDRKYLQRAHK